MNTDLRKANQNLLDRLRRSQEEISQLIIAVKHSDHRVLESMPLTSTLANHHKNVTFQPSKNFQPSRRIGYKSPGASILKLKPSLTKRLSPSRNAKAKKSPQKRQTVSRFLQRKAAEGRELLASSYAQGDSLLTSPGNSRPTRMNHSVSKQEPLVQLNTKTDDPPVQVTFKTLDNGKHAQSAESGKRQTPPLLGYDWIAGLVDNEEPSPNYSQSFLEEMKEFRRVNRSECHSTKYWNEIMRTPKTPIDKLSPCRHFKIKQKTPDPSDTRDPRIINFTINKRLFPVPVDPSENIPPGTDYSPRYIRVSIPKSSLMSPFRYRAMHRNNYTDGFDSLALPDHCVMGWQHTVHQNVDKSQNVNGLDLRSSMRPRENLVDLQLKSGQASIPVKNEGKDLSFLHDASSFKY